MLCWMCQFRPSHLITCTNRFYSQQSQDLNETVWEIDDFSKWNESLGDRTTVLSSTGHRPKYATYPESDFDVVAPSHLFAARWGREECRVVKYPRRILRRTCIPFSDC